MKQIRPRAAIIKFARLMEYRLRQHDASRGRSGWGWSDCDWLYDRLREEARELRKELAADDRSGIAISDEAADVANFAMMIADNQVVWHVDRDKAQG